MLKQHKGSLSPKLSIIIPVHNQVKYTKMCLESIRLNTSEDYEIIVINNASKDATVPYLSQFPDISIIHNKENLGFARSVNQGLSTARGEYLIVLNNDCLVFPGWEQSLMRAAQIQDVGIIGVMSNFAASPQLIRIQNKDLNSLSQVAQEIREKNHNSIISVTRIAGLCMLIKRELIDRIGGFDPRFGLGFFEDDDFCLRSILSGYRNVIAQDVFVYHFGSMTFRSKRPLKEKLMRENWQKFKEK